MNKQTAVKKTVSGKKRRNRFLPLLAAVVIVAAAAVMIVPKLLPGESVQADGAAADLSADGSAVVIDTAAVSETAMFIDYDAGGTTVELFAVRASDGSVRLALNTCQVCNGSPYAYFVQTGNVFICQNCRNRFSSSQVGLVSGGCNPVPITGADYTAEDGTILVSTAFLDANAVRFANWKNF